MCGIVGFLASSKRDIPQIAKRLTDSLEHRGPNDQGLWIDQESGLALGHRRLSIVDLSPLGHQPMISKGMRYVLTYNGEVFNFMDLSKELQSRGHRFRGASDTEVLLASFEEWGVENAVRRFVGMFAFALFDREKRELHLVRDRLGIKPLYFGWSNGTFLFSSELKAIKEHPDFVPRISRSVLSLFMRFNYVPTPYSIYEGIFKLCPGSILSLPIDEILAMPSDFSPQLGESRISPRPFWSAQEIVERGLRDPFKGTEQDAVAELEALLRNAVKLRMIADVPLGAFLSGGIDSSTIVALMQTQSSIPIRTFSIGFYEDRYNEAEYAKKVAWHLGTDHTELYVTPKDAMDVIPKLSTLYDEPFSDSSQIPTFLVSHLARRHVTVSLSGDGGDELFGGYSRYIWARNIWRMLSLMPVPMRHPIRRFLKSFSPSKWNRFFWAFGSCLPSSLRFSNPGEKVHKLADVLGAKSGADLYFGLLSHWGDPSKLVLDSVEPITSHRITERWPADLSFLDLMMFIDLVNYLPDDILTKVDRASMGVSLEARVPFLDHRVVEFAWRLPLSMKVRNGQGKWILRQILYKYVPKGLVERPKMGFGVPVGAWLRGPLREWAEDLLNERLLERQGYFNVPLVREKWKLHLEGSGNWEYCLWDVLVFQAWLSENLGAQTRPGEMCPSAHLHD